MRDEIRGVEDVGVGRKAQDKGGSICALDLSRMADVLLNVDVVSLFVVDVSGIVCALFPRETWRVGSPGLLSPSALQKKQVDAS